MFFIKFEYNRCMKDKEHNVAFIDGQNLYLGTVKCNRCSDDVNEKNDCSCGSSWRVDLKKFRVYLKENYFIEEAYYYLGNVQEENSELYKKIQKAGFILEFKEHSSLAKSKKKGNVDTDIVFEVMKTLVEDAYFNKILLVSGDGDYSKMVDYLIKKDRFKKILHPNKKYASSLYKKLGSEYFDYFENIRTMIEVKEKGS